MAFDGLLGTPPQLAGLLSRPRGRRVVASGHSGWPSSGSSRPCRVKQAAGRPCGAGGGIAAGVAGPGRQGSGTCRGRCAGGPGGCGPGRRRGGEGDEHGGMGGHGRGDAFAADEPGADQLVGVAAVGLGAAGAGGGAPVAAWLVDHAVRHADGGDGAQELAGGRVDVRGCRRVAGRGGYRRRRARRDRARRGIRRSAARRTRSSANWEWMTRSGSRRTAGTRVRSCERAVRGPPPAPGTWRVLGVRASIEPGSGHGAAPVLRGRCWCPGRAAKGVAAALLGSLRLTPSAGRCRPRSSRSRGAR